jgi:2-polyprenyl-3-methyl-5-hydroxy-6-metoxy-1,4-benzoquinol methylase
MTSGGPKGFDGNASNGRVRTVETLNACNLCGGTRFLAFTRKRSAFTGRTFAIVRCKDCGLTFVNPRLTEGENRALYDEAYFKGAGFDESVDYTTLDHPTRAGENAGIIAKIRALRPGNDLRILDVGCSTGSLLRALEQAGYADLWGLDLSEYAASVARSATRATIVVGDAIGADFGGVQFDVINATEVVEHLRDPLAFFRRVRALLRDGGVFIYNTGNIAGAYARAFGRFWPYIHPEGHLFYYSPATLERYFRTVGLEPLFAADLDRERRNIVACAEAQIAHSQLLFLAASDSRDLYGRLFRIAARAPQRMMSQLMVRALGRLAMPMAIHRVQGAPSLDAVSAPRRTGSPQENVVSRR